MPNLITGMVTRGKQEGQTERYEDRIEVRGRKEERDQRRYTTGFKGGGRDHKQQNADDFWKLEKSGKHLRDVRRNQPC